MSPKLASCWRELAAASPWGQGSRAPWRDYSLPTVPSLKLLGREVLQIWDFFRYCSISTQRIRDLRSGSQVQVQIHLFHLYLSHTAWRWLYTVLLQCPCILSVICHIPTGVGFSTCDVILVWAWVCSFYSRFLSHEKMRFSKYRHLGGNTNRNGIYSTEGENGMHLCSSMRYSS